MEGYRKLSKSIKNISMFNFEEHSPLCIHFLKKMNAMIKLGYISNDSLSEINIQIQNISEAIITKQNNIQKNTYPSLCSISDAMEHLKLYIDDATFGSIALCSKSHYQMILNFFGDSLLEIFILKHYSTNEEYIIRASKIKIGDTNINMPLNIIARKKLRKIIGPELYFKSNCEVFFKSDLEYVKTCNKFNAFIIPNTVCLMCCEIKSANNMHSNCKYINPTLGNPYYLKSCVPTFLNYEYLCPELVELSKKNYDENFSLETKFDPNLEVCKTRGSCNCSYNEILHNGTVTCSFHFLTNGEHDCNWKIYEIIADAIKNDTKIVHSCDGNQPTKITNKPTPRRRYMECNNCTVNNICDNYVIPQKSLYGDVSIHTPCNTCMYPRFLHGFDRTKVIFNKD